MNDSYYIVDNEFNRTNNKDVIGYSFVIPPAFCDVIPVKQAPDFINFAQFKKLKEKGLLGNYPPLLRST
jgi:hypothetical protein